MREIDRRTRRREDRAENRFSRSGTRARALSSLLRLCADDGEKLCAVFSHLPPPSGSRKVSSSTRARARARLTRHASVANDYAPVTLIYRAIRPASGTTNPGKFLRETAAVRITRTIRERRHLRGKAVLVIAIARGTRNSAWLSPSLPPCGNLDRH